MARLKFAKMQGLGNDFMVIDAVNQKFKPEKKTIALWGDRHFGVGFDQLLVIEKSTREDCAFKYRIFNCDGKEVEQCGNGARCFAKYVYEKGLTRDKKIRVETKGGVIVLAIEASGLVEVNMGAPKFKPEEIPFIPAKEENPAPYIHVISIGAMALPVVCVNVGNPHAVVMVDSLEATPIESWGPSLESSEQFPEGTNVEFVEVKKQNHIKVRVYERGVGETLACGTGACAAVVAGVVLELLSDKDKVVVSLPGGDLSVRWKKGGDIFMTGPAEFVFAGELEL